MNWFFDRTQVAGIDELVRACGASALRSPYRSTVPLLDLLRRDSSRLLELAGSKLGLEGPPEALHLEYKVRPPQGAGKASYTDAMVVNHKRMLAIEVKWHEPRYDDVAKWLGKGAANRSEVLEGWLSLINKRLGTRLEAKQISALPYQLIHRTASACSTARGPALAYLQFVESGQSPAEWIRTDLEALRRLVSDTALPMTEVTVALEPTAAFESVAGLEKGAARTGEAMIEALLGGRLFTTGDWISTSI